MCCLQWFWTLTALSRQRSCCIFVGGLYEGSCDKIYILQFVILLSIMPVYLDWSAPSFLSHCMRCNYRSSSLLNFTLEWSGSERKRILRLYYNTSCSNGLDWREIIAQLQLCNLNPARKTRKASQLAEFLLSNTPRAGQLSEQFHIKIEGNCSMAECRRLGKQFVCDICEVSFPYPSKLKRHLRSRKHALFEDIKRTRRYHPDELASRL